MPLRALHEGMRALLVMPLLLVAGCLAGPSATLAPSAEPELERAQDQPGWAPPPENVRARFAYDGRTVMGACARDDGACDEPSRIGAPENTLFAPTYEGDPRSLWLNITWQHATQLTQEMTVTILACPASDCGESQVIGADRGLSPIEFGVTLDALAEGATLAIRVDNADVTPGPFVHSWEQPFHVEGALDLTTMPLPAPR